MHPVLLSLCLLIPTPGHAPRGEELARDPGAEEGARAPKAWQRGNPVDGVEYLWDDDAAEGEHSLSLKKEVERFFPIAEWRQEVPHDGKSRKLHFGALVKAKAARKAILDVQFVDAQGGRTHAWAAYVGARQAGDPPADHDWMWYSGVVEVPAGTETLGLGLQIYGPGQVWFDRMRARYVDDATPATEAARLEPRPAEAWGELPVVAPAEATDAGASGSEPIAIDGDANRRYLLVGPRAEAPKKGYRLLVVLPGGDGSAEFAPFVREIAARALPESYLLAQVIAPAWSASDDRVVWPTRKLADPAMKFPTEELVADVIDDVARAHALDLDHVYLLGWSSGGPPCYAAATEKRTKVRGALVAMSVFKPEHMDRLRNAKGRRFYVLHSPEDFIPMRFPEAAVRELAEAGAATHLETYAGGHGWHGDVFGQIAAGIRWLESDAKE